MSTEFLSRTDLYHGDFNCVMRNPDCEVDSGTHYHDFYELQFYFSNAGQIRVGDKHYALHYGDIALIGMFEKHTLFYSPGLYYNRFCISLDPSFIISACSDKSNLLSLFSRSNPSYPIYHLEDKDFRELLSILYEYEQCRLTHGQDIMHRAYLYMVLARLYDHFYDGQQVNQQDSQYITLLAKLIRFINEHLSEELSLDRLAAEVNFSTYHVCRIFKRYTGNTLTQYIITKRIDLAKYMLGQNMSITEVCQSAGFNNYSYFYKTFHRLTGLSPAEYRELLPHSTEPKEQAVSY